MLGGQSTHGSSAATYGGSSFAVNQHRHSSSGMQSMDGAGGCELKGEKIYTPGVTGNKYEEEQSHWVKE